jgi:hypothetical protein
MGTVKPEYTMTTSALKYGRWSADANSLPAAGVAYLLQNGFNQSMTDAGAMTREEKAKLLREHGHEADASAVESGARAKLSPEGEAVVAAVIDEWRQDRFNDILKGTVGTRVGTGGPRLDPLTREMRAVAEGRIRIIADAKNISMPTGKVLTAAVERIIDRDGDAIRTEAAARLKANKASAAALDDLFDDLGEADEQAAA